MFCLTGRSSELSCDISPPIDVSDGEWEIGLIDLSTYNSTPNIEEGINNEFLCEGLESPIKLPTGVYEIGDIESTIKDRLPKKVEFSLKPNNNTLQAVISCSREIDFTTKGSIASMLGFEPGKYPAKLKHESTNPVEIIKVEALRVECNIVRGSYINGAESHVIHEFYVMVDPGYKIVEVPGTVIYLPLNVQTISNVTVQIKDQSGRLVNFRGEVITLRLHLRRKHGSNI